jgi:hypothetical protein
MGIDVNGSRFLIFARRAGVDFCRTLMIGRQALHLSPEHLAANLSEFGHPTTATEAQALIKTASGFAEPFFLLLGAQETESLDASNFEGATHVHDLNMPVKTSMLESFSVVLDGGTLEHVFNFPQAIKNCMEMVSVGGHYLGITPTSNFSGHGFYQFSPELYFRIFSSENGFRVERMLLYEDTPGSPWYEVVDPVTIHSRVSFINLVPSYLVMIARKTESVQIFRSWPQQSDYSVAWTSLTINGKTSIPTKPPTLLRKVLRKPARLLAVLSFLRKTALLHKRYGYEYPTSCFRHFDPQSAIELP